MLKPFPGNGNPFLGVTGGTQLVASHTECFNHLATQLHLNTQDMYYNRRPPFPHLSHTHTHTQITAHTQSEVVANPWNHVMSEQGWQFLE